jgi:hypothetical protein
MYLQQQHGRGFKGQRPGWSPRGLHKTETESTDFTETSASLKSRSSFVLLVSIIIIIIIIIRNKKKNCQNLNLLLLTGALTTPRSALNRMFSRLSIMEINSLICKLYEHTQSHRYTTL